MIALLAAVLGAQAAGCEAFYAWKLRTGRDEAAGVVGAGAIGAASSTGTLVLARAPEMADGVPMLYSTAALFATGPSTVGWGAVEVARRRELLRVLRTLQQARIGDGLELRELASSVEVSGVSAPVEPVASVLAGSPAPCSGGLMDWDALVAYVGGAIAAPPSPASDPSTTTAPSTAADVTSTESVPVVPTPSP